MKLDPLLSRACKLAKKREYEKALKMLRDEEDRYHGSFKYYYLCGVFCLYANMFLDAKHYFESARKIKIKDPSTMLGMAVLYIRGMGSKGTNTSQAVDYYLDVLDIDPKNKTANKALEILRANSAPDELADWLTPERLQKLFPPIPAPSLSPEFIMIGSGIIAAFLLVFTGILISKSILPNPFKNKNARPTVDFVLSGDIKKAPVETGGTYSYILTRSEAINLYEQSLKLFSNYRDEKAKINLNKILESNASEGLKNRARILMANTAPPRFDNFKKSDNIDYQDIIKEPLLYRDVHVIWRGMATNVEITDEHTRFDFLIGYDTKRSLEGIVTVTFNVPISINTDRPLEVLGRVEVSDTVTLQGVAIHQSGKLE